MREWPRNTVKALRSFHGLTSYYRKYVRNYDTICKILTDLLKKDSFNWGEEAEKAFETLKVAMTNTLVLALPDYSQEFIVETHASHSGIRVVLMQGGKPIAYFNI